MDTSSGSVKLSCCEHYGNVLNEYSDPELKAVRACFFNKLHYFCKTCLPLSTVIVVIQIIDVATRRKDHLKSDMISHYKEV